ncbi:hypothetical protein [Kribbella deserti]|uniref:Uncharacterized protein n=1 Tax=Kribbella deserti TaxID=1926257 RepID=A0ABV6QNS2_9ACTN
MTAINWPTGSQGQTFARAYLAAFPLMVAGIAWVLIGQATGNTDGPAYLIAVVVFLISQAILVALAMALRSRSSSGNYAQNWQRLSLGLELRAALAVLRTT